MSWLNPKVTEKKEIEEKKPNQYTLRLNILHVIILTHYMTLKHPTNVGFNHYLTVLLDLCLPFKEDYIVDPINGHEGASILVNFSSKR